MKSTRWERACEWVLLSPTKQAGCEEGMGVRNTEPCPSFLPSVPGDAGAVHTTRSPSPGPQPKISLLPEIDSFCCSVYFPQRLCSAPSWYVESHKKAFLAGQRWPSLCVPAACPGAGFGPRRFQSSSGVCGAKNTARANSSCRSKRERCHLGDGQMDGWMLLCFSSFFISL